MNITEQQLLKDSDLNFFTQSNEIFETTPEDIERLKEYSKHLLRYRDGGMIHFMSGVRVQRTQIGVIQNGAILREVQRVNATIERLEKKIVENSMRKNNIKQHKSDIFEV